MTLPLPGLAQGGRVLRTTGDWRLAQDIENAVRQGQLVNESDTLLAPVSRRHGDRIVMWFQSARVMCSADPGEGLICYGGRDLCVLPEENARTAPLERCLDGPEGKPASFLANVLRFFGEEPRRYLPLLSREPGPSLREAVLLAGQDALALREVLQEFQAGDYEVCLRGLDSGAETCAVASWNGSEGSWEGHLKPGLYELIVRDNGRYSTAWVLLARAGEYEELKADFQRAERLTEQWIDADPIEVRAALRAWLQALYER